MNTKICEAKAKVVDEIADLVQNSAATVVVEYRGLAVKNLEVLRKELAKDNVVLHVFKNTLVMRALKKLNIDTNADLEGPNAFVFSKDDVVAGPKIISKFAKTNPKMIIKTGFMDGKEISKEDISTLATLPSREGLLSMFLGCLNEPVRKFAATLQAVVDNAE